MILSILLQTASLWQCDRAGEDEQLLLVRTGGSGGNRKDRQEGAWGGWRCVFMSALTNLSGLDWQTLIASMSIPGVHVDTVMPDYSH